MTRARRPIAAILLSAAGILLASVLPGLATVPDVPVHSDPWTTMNRPRQSPTGSSSSNGRRSHRQLEEQASLETRETFGEEFCRQLEGEEEAVRSVNQRRARVSREAGCSPASPLSSPSLGAAAGVLGVPGGAAAADADDERAREQEGAAIGDWLR